MIRITADISLNEGEIHYSFIHASGPGGQHINKVATAVQLRFDLAGSSSLPDTVKERLTKGGDRRITDAGEIVITARRYRTQERNKQDALERLITLIRKATRKPKPRRKTRPTSGSIEKRLKEKQRRKKIKQNRQAVDPGDE